jgi:hypothetical protein
MWWPRQLPCDYWVVGLGIQHGYTGQRDDSYPRCTEQYGIRFHYATYNGMQFKIYEIFISGMFHLIFSDHSWLRVTEPIKSETVDGGRLLKIKYLLLQSRADRVFSSNAVGFCGDCKPWL